MKGRERARGAVGTGRARACWEVGRGGGGGGGSMLGYCSRNLSHNYCTVRSRSLLPSCCKASLARPTTTLAKERPRLDTNGGVEGVTLSPAEIMEYYCKTREPRMLHEY